MTVQVKHNVVTSNLRKGDIVVGAPKFDLHVTDDDYSQALVVDSVARKIEWATVSFSNATSTLRRRVADEWVVVRTELTDEEKAAKERAHSITWLTNALSELLARNPVDVTNTIVEHNAEFAVKRGGLFDYGDLGKILEAQSLYKVAVHVQSLIDFSRKQRPDATDDEVLVDGWARWFYDVTDRRSDRSHNNPLSRSTAVLSNLIEDMDMWALAKVLDDWKWQSGRKLVEARVAELKAEWEAEQEADRIARLAN